MPEETIKTFSKYLYVKWDITYNAKDPNRPNLFGRPKDSFYFDNRVGFEISAPIIWQNYRLANLTFEYKINPQYIQEIGQDFNLIGRWRFKTRF